MGHAVLNLFTALFIVASSVTVVLYLNPTNDFENESQSALECPLHAYCDNNTSIPRAMRGMMRSVVPLSPGFYGVNNFTLFLPCSPADACLGNNTCNKHYTGDFCAICANGRYRHDDNTCVACSSSQYDSLISTAVIAILICVAALGLSVDGNKHDGRFGLISIVIAWSQFAGEFWTVI